MSQETFLGNSSWTRSFLDIAQLYLAFLTDIEVNSGASNLDEFQQNSADQWQAFLAIEQYLEEKNITIDQMRQHLRRQVLQLYQLEASLIFIDEQIVNFAFPLTNTISPVYVCVKSEHHILFDFANSHVIYIQLDTTNFAFSELSPVITFNLIDDIFLDATIQFQSTVSFGEKNNLGLSLPAVYRSLQEIDGEQQCSWTSPWTCRASCRANYIRATCNCEPIAWPELYQDGKENCSLKFYNNSCHQLLRDIGFSNCSTTTNCLNYCDDGTYETATYLASTPSNKQTGIQIQYFGSLSYPLYVQQWPWTTETFVGALGGVLGLWLGIDLTILLSIVLAPLTFCSCDIRRYRAKKRIEKANVVETDDDKLDFVRSCDKNGAPVHGVFIVMEEDGTITWKNVKNESRKRNLSVHIANKKKLSHSARVGNTKKLNYSVNVAYKKKLQLYDQEISPIEPPNPV